MKNQVEDIVRISGTKTLRFNCIESNRTPPLFFIKFLSSGILKNSDSLVLPGGADIMVSEADAMVFKPESIGQDGIAGYWRAVSFSRNKK